MTDKNTSLESSSFLGAQGKKIAVVHDYLVYNSGAERVLKEIMSLYEDADLYTLLDTLDVAQRGFVSDKSVTTSSLQRMPFVKKRYQKYLFLMPLFVEQFDLTGYDIIISSSFAVAHGVLTGPNQLHISYTHSPMRYAWDLQFQYLDQFGLKNGIKGWAAKCILHYMRLWDVQAANRVDYFVANSSFVARRILKYYRREASVIYPPVDTDYFTCGNGAEKEDYFITFSRFVPYKKIDLIVKTFAQLGHRLLVIGDGPDLPKVKQYCGGKVELLGYQSKESLREYLQKARAFIFMAEEDFGIALVEAQACGIPVIAFGRGGALETIRGIWVHQDWPEDFHPTGVWFPEQDSVSLKDAVGCFMRFEDRFSAEECRQNALNFSEERFRREMRRFVEEKWEESRG